MPIYDCGAPGCEECEKAFGPNRAKAVAEYREKSRRWSKHVHVAGTTHGRDIDECAFCGLDIRDDIHAKPRLYPSHMYVPAPAVAKGGAIFGGAICGFSLILTVTTGFSLIDPFASVIGLVAAATFYAMGVAIVYKA